MSMIRVFTLTSKSIRLLAITLLAIALLAMGSGAAQAEPVAESVASPAGLTRGSPVDTTGSFLITPQVDPQASQPEVPNGAPQGEPVAERAASPTELTRGSPVDTTGLLQAIPQVDLQLQPEQVPIGLENPKEIERLKESLQQAVPTGLEKPTELEEPEPLAPDLIRTFEGFTYTGTIPPDPIMAAAPSDLVVAVNRSWRIYNKTGGQLFNTTLLSWFSNVLPSNTSGISVFDPWVIYDRGAGRYVLLALARRNSDQFSRFLISVSDNNTATGNWCNWSLDATLNGSTSTNNWADYAKIGNNNNAIILSANMFRFSDNAFQYAKLRFLPKASLYNTSCPGLQWWDFWDLRNANNSRAFTIQPAHSYFGSNTDYLVNTTSSGSGSQLTLWRAVNNSSSNPQPTLTRAATINVSSYSAPPDAQQPGTSTRIETGDARLLNAIWRGGGLWTAHTISCTWSGDSTTRSCLRWYQLNPGAGNVLQSGTFGAPGFHYYYPAITADPSNNAWLVFNRSSSTEFAGIRYTGRNSTTPPNSLQGSAQLRAGQGCYVRLDTRNRNRWGDYNGAAWDPASGRAWIFSEFAFGTSSSCGSNVWRTQVGELLIP